MIVRASPLSARQLPIPYSCSPLSARMRHVLLPTQWRLFNLWPMPLLQRHLESCVARSVRMLPPTFLINAPESMQYLIAISQILSKEEMKHKPKGGLSRGTRGMCRAAENRGLETRMGSLPQASLANFLSTEMLQSYNAHPRGEAGCQRWVQRNTEGTVIGYVEGGL